MTQSKQSFLDYDGFVEKFKPKKTTDDCMTPPEVMEVVNSYVERRWGIDRSRFVRPFWLGGDYEHTDYPDGCVVVDNPPFSMLAKIRRFYLANGVPFFLFCPSLTAFSSYDERCCVLLCDSNITYENGANVRTGFVTSLPSPNVAESEPDLGDAINAVCDELRHHTVNKLPKYEYPPEVVTAARMQWYAAHHTRYAVPKGECCKISALDSQRGSGKTIFGGGLLLSERAAAERAAAECAAAECAAAERAAAERAAAERAAAKVWTLSERERAMQSALGGE
jgi:hypothetical protein